MPALTASDIDLASIITNLGLAGAATLTVVITTFGWKKVLGFFGR